MVIHGMTQNNMPELPEVETVKNCLKEMLLGKTIKSVTIYRDKNIENKNIDDFINGVTNGKIIDFSRVGKYIIFIFNNKKVMLSHLRMEGKYFIRKEGEKPNYHDLVVFHLDDGTYLAYNDTRRFGTLQVNDFEGYRNASPLDKVGPDPFEMKDASLLVNAFKKVRTAIKPSLLDQSIMSGLGNIYVDEVLFDCKIHPETPANLITVEQFDQIWKSSKYIMGNAIGAGGTTIKSYHPREGINGNFQFELKVYGQNGGKCVRCGTPLFKKFVGGRGTTYCPHCQKNVALPYIVGLTGPIGAGKSTACNHFKELGFKIISADSIVHDLYKKDSIQKEIKTFIPTLKIVDGEIFRPELKEYLLENPRKKIQLQTFIHDKTKKEILSRIKKFKHNDKVVVEVPLLFEAHYNEFCDDTVLIKVTNESQKRNLLNRKENIEKALKLNANFTANKKATYTITNDGSVADLNKQIDSIFCK